MSDAAREPDEKDDAPAEKARPKRTLGRRVLRALGAVLATVLLALVLVVGYLHTDAGGELLRARLEARLNERVTTAVTIGALRFSLFSGLTLERIAVRDRDDQPAVTIERAFVLPRLGQILRGTIALDDVKVTGVRVDVRGRPDGTTNLTGLAKPSPPRAAKEDATPSDKRVVVRALAIRDVELHLAKPDGLDVAIERAALTADAIDARPGQSTVGGSLGLRVGRVAVRRPDLALVMTDLATDARAALVDGVGRLELGPTGAAIDVTREGAGAPVTTKLALPRVTVDLTKERLAVALESLELAALALASAKVEVAREDDGRARRVTSANLTKLVVRAEDVAKLAGKPVLASDLTIDVDASGPPEAFTPSLRVASAGGEVTLRATLDTRDPEVLRYDATLTTTALDVSRIAARAPAPLTIGSATATAKGERRGASPPRLTATLAVRDVVVRDVVARAVDARVRVEDGTVTIESLDVDALGQRLSATGTYRPEDKAVDVRLRVDARVRELLAELRRAGVLTTPPSPLASALALSKPATIHVVGRADGELVVHVTDLDARVAGGSARAGVTARLKRGDTSKGEKAVALEDIEADVDLRGVSLAQIGRLRGKPLPVSGRATGRVRVRGSAEKPLGDVDLTVELVAPEAPSERVATLRLKGAATETRLDAHATLTDASGARLAEADVKGARRGRGVGAPLAVTVDVPPRSLGEIGKLLRPEVREKLPADVSVGLTAKVTGGSGRTVVEADARAELAPGRAPVTLRARADIAGGVDRIATAPATWTLDVDVPETPISDLPLPPERTAGLRGAVAVAVHARGTRADVTGDVKVSARGVARGASPPVDADVALALTDDAATAKVSAAASGVDVLDGTLRAALGGRGLLAAAQRRQLATVDPALEGELRVPEHATAEWARLVPDAGKLPGRAGGRLTVSGKARDPELALHVGYAGYRTLSGDEGSLSVDARGRGERATVRVAVNDRVTLRAELSPRELLDARRDGAGEARVHAALEADAVPLAALLPDSEAVRASRPEGVLDAHLTADASLVFRGETRELGTLALRGPLTVKDGAFVLPSTWRRIHHVGVAIEGDGERLAIRRIEAKESDRDEPDRHVRVDGSYAVRERALALHAATHRVLVSGGSFGMLDAPRAALTAEVDVSANLAGPVKRVEVDVRALDLESGDRQPRATQQEVLHLGDVIEVGSGVAVGELPVPERAAPTATPATPLRPEDKTLAIVVRLPNGVHVKQRPLEVYAKGEVHIDRYGDRRVLSGALQATGGSLLVGGRLHPLEHGEVRMTDDGPRLDLHFRRTPHPAALRDMATADGTDVLVHMVGPMAKPTLSFSGKSDGLFETLALENIGRVRVLSTPDRPAAQTPQLPLVPQIRQTAFMSANLPHLAFLDRANVYANPNAGRFAYGRFEDLEAERYSKDGTRRIRTTVRSRVVGQSDAEVEGSLLFRNDARVVSGIGLLGGTRVGGGPTIFLEWSSAD
ncbi:MAG: translocation/assembly module TamB domain-containing protein [Labilithrix sp.]|nr:translocation/assembly module TamB domain-containing protein [Labilithrix sp.]